MYSKHKAVHTVPVFLRQVNTAESNIDIDKREPKPCRRTNPVREGDLCYLPMGLGVI